MGNKTFIFGAIATIVVFAFVFKSCTGKYEVFSYKTQWQGKPFELKVWNKQQYSNFYQILEFNFDNKKPIAIKSSDLTSLGFPYRKDMFDKVPYVKLDSIRRFANISKDDENAVEKSFRRWPYIIYVNPKDFTKTDFEQLAACLKENANAMEDSLYSNYISPQHHLNYPQLVGLVYGQPEDFTKIYSDGQIDLHIFPDGRVIANKKNDIQNFEFTGWIDDNQQLCLLQSDFKIRDPNILDGFKEVKTSTYLKQDFKISFSEQQPLPDWARFKEKIEGSDLSNFWKSGNAIQTLENEAYTIPEPYGYIGNNFQRFYIHFNKIEKDQVTQNYRVSGKTKVKDVIKNFTGTFTIVSDSIRTLPSMSNDEYLNGSLLMYFKLEEEKAKPNTGVYEGKMLCYWFMDNNGTIQYNILDMPDIINNQAEGKYVPYDKSPASRVAWGDGEIPNAQKYTRRSDAVGEWHVLEEYVKNGWQNFTNIYSRDEKVSATALKNEFQPWWQ